MCEANGREDLVEGGFHPPGAAALPIVPRVPAECSCGRRPLAARVAGGVGSLETESVTGMTFFARHRDEGYLQSGVSRRGP